jgi:hypothetical protein
MDALDVAGAMTTRSNSVAAAFWRHPTHVRIGSVRTEPVEECLSDAAVTRTATRGVYPSRSGVSPTVAGSEGAASL